MICKAICELEGVSPYSQSKAFETARGGELPDEYERKHWRERMHVDKDGMVIIPPMAFTNNLQQAAKYSGLKVKGQGKATYTKHFNSGVMCIEPAYVINENGSRINQLDVGYDYLFVPSDGKAGGGSRVFKYFPRIDKWFVTVEYIVLDPVITEEVFTKVLIIGGSLIGLGRFRPANRGYYGRFKVTSMQWIEVSD